MKDMITKDLGDDSIVRFFHVHITDNAVMLVLERKGIAAEKISHHYFCFGKYSTTIDNQTIIDGIMVSQAVSGLFKIYYNEEHNKSIIEIEFKDKNTFATDQIPVSQTK